MSWMDSWSRPSKQAAVPPPLYLVEGESAAAYCRSCGRVISSRKSNSSKLSNEVKYCSDRCRKHKPGPWDKQIEQKIVALLDDEDGSGIDETAARSRVVKGDKRLLITCDEIEELVFGSRHDPTKTYGRRKNRASRAIGGVDEEWRSVDMEDAPDNGNNPIRSAGVSSHLGPLIRPPQAESDVNGSIGGEKGRAERSDETVEDQMKRLEGQRRADEREMVRRAARRAVVFGFVKPTLVDAWQGVESKGRSKVRSSRFQEPSETRPDPAEPNRKCEAVMNGFVVEPSFAKGNWAIRWRD